ncbi:MAG: hypothetical protein JRH06_02390 [Deltaproteobacteria bacterium]|nr:hypothetical protein [Deltaproteobacteria bacterium]MBW2136388.1 hypothetical protein [Deltaproteobacteria bacterium]
MVIIGVDTGGTFTDFVFKEGEDWGVYKVISTPSDPARAVRRNETFEKPFSETATHSTGSVSNDMVASLQSRREPPKFSKPPCVTDAHQRLS